MAQAGEQEPVVTGRVNTDITVDHLTVNRGANLTNQTTAPATPSGGAVVYSQYGVAVFMDTSGNVTSLKNPDPTAADSGLIAWSFDPAAAASTFLTTAGVVYLSKVIVTQQQTLTNGLVEVSTAGGTLTASENYLALFNSTGTQIAISADQSTAFASAGLITAAWASPVVSAAPGAYYVGVLCNGGTAITLASGSALKPGGVSIGNAGLATATGRFLSSGTSQTAMPQSVTLGSASGNLAATIWAAIS